MTMGRCPLSNETEVITAMMVYSSTDIGLSRSENQDSYTSGTVYDAVFAVVCDGMGGSNAGSEASKRAAAMMHDRIEKSYQSDYDSNKIRNLLLAAVRTTNAVIYDLGSTVSEWRGMGTTCVAALCRGNMLHIVNVGDSRAYLISHEITQITRDHSMVMRMYEKGEITKEELKNHPNKNVITRAVGVSYDVNPDYFELELPEGGAVLLCTDGLSNYCDEGFMFRTVKDFGAENAPEILVRKALENGGRDNITVSLLK